MAHISTAGYRKIGFGQCGLILERPGRNFVLKIARRHFEEALWNDCLSHARVYGAFIKQPFPECRVPILFSYVANGNAEWWSEHGKFLPPMPQDFPVPSSVMISERILPLPKPVRNALIDHFCPSNLKETVKSDPANRDCLVRVYLGRRRTPGAPKPPNFSLRNFNLCLDQMIFLGLPIREYASAMAEALAIMHWSAHIDAYDVEFVLGSEAEVKYRRPLAELVPWNIEDLEKLPPNTDLDKAMHVNFSKRTMRMWLIDFNLCSRWKASQAVEHPDEVVSQLVLAFFENDPYYPLPLMELDLDKELWSVFREKYLWKSNDILSSGHPELRQLPGRFIDECVAREQKKLAQGLGHGHRDLKG
jgi:hypothetical protein